MESRAGRIRPFTRAMKLRDRCSPRSGAFHCCSANVRAALSSGAVRSDMLGNCGILGSLTRDFHTSGPPVQPEVNIKPAQADEPQAGGQEVDKQTADAPEADELESDEAEADEVFETDCESNDSYLFADALHHKFKTCIDLLRNVSPKKDALVVVDGKTTPVSLMAAFLCLSGITAGTAGQSSVAVQVATNDDLKMVKRPVDVVINFNMAMSLKGLADRGAVLGKDGKFNSVFLGACYTICGAFHIQSYTEQALP